MVHFDLKETRHTDWKADGPVYQAIPEIFIKFASGCQLDSGYRLLWRTLSYSFDSKCESIDNQVIKLISYKGKLGLIIKAPIPASMKKVVYDGTVVFTADKLLCSRCNCKSGSQCSDRVAGAHTLARAYLLTRLMAKDLAEHMLLGLASMITSCDVEKDNWSSDQNGQIRICVIALMKASREETLANEAGSMNTLFEVLKAYCTQTPRSNK